VKINTQNKKKEQVTALAITPGTLVPAHIIAKRISTSPRYILQLADAGRIPVLRIGKKCVRFEPFAVAAALGFNWEAAQ
jgi:hypothetical protein